VSQAGHKTCFRKVPTGGAEKQTRCDGSKPRAASQGSKNKGRANGAGPQITASNKENPMSLGVLNNLSAVYAENNLSNTNGGLQKTLQQLSSGSKINSGADDAAGLSLVDGLQANQQALTQSETNSTEGVGLLQVADGALSQVTSLLNRAVTLATEVSNGTLNSSQDTAANQEYQSILSEITNIGSTTTYNQNQVFNSNTAIYTGDSTQSGASVDDLNIRSLSSSNLGDTNGTMSYSSSGANGNVFIDLGASSTVSDALNSGGKTTLTINTLSATGAVVANAISVGTGTGYANTTQGMINAINNSGLGLTASFTTDKIAGSGTTGDGGIMIQGAVGASQFSNTANVVDGTAGVNTDSLTGSITFQLANGQTQSITSAQVAAAETTTTLADWVTYITANTGTLGIAASDTTAGTLKLTASTATNQLSVSANLTDATHAADTVSATSVNTSVSNPTQVSYSGTVSGGASINDIVSGSITMQVGTNSAVTITTAQVAAADGIAQGAVTLGNFNNYINSDTGLGVTSEFGGTNGGSLLLQSTNGQSALKVTSNLVDNSLSSGPTSMSYTANAAYSAGITTGTFATTGIADTSAAGGHTAQTVDATILPGTTTSGGVATISYTDKSGESLQNTDLSNTTDAQSALTALNAAIADVAGQDGYIGAQINTLNAVSNVLSTQQENIESAQNAVQATDYASASTNLSKYEILSQTGIAALAQANSVQQEVTKLLQ